MFRDTTESLPVALWSVAVTGALAVLVGPAVPWGMAVEFVGLAVSLTATMALVMWFVRR